MPIQPTAFGARDRGDFNVFLCCAPGGRQLMGRPLDGGLSHSLALNIFALSLPVHVREQ